MRASIRIALGAATLAGLSFYGLYHASIAVIYFSNIPAMIVAGILSGNIHAPHPAAFAFASFGQWTLALWSFGFALSYAKRRKKPNRVAGGN